MDALLSQLKGLYPQLTFTAGNGFVWSPETGEIFYGEGRKGAKARWALLHETGHALLGHKSYQADYELIRLEVAAWERAKELASQLDIKIDEDHIQDCLDTYRDWLYKRSICPGCSTKSLQQDDFTYYRCYNCHTTWRVTPSRFCRAYRSTKNVQQASAVFRLDNLGA
ncbi:MAG TPA: hypothetical protein VFI84_02650 [Candidatus Saccharimonadales bacterium]|nr:hypothetical protein [Candidatus Saccharimonadales bacterium]